MQFPTRTFELGRTRVGYPLVAPAGFDGFLSCALGPPTPLIVESSHFLFFASIRALTDERELKALRRRMSRYDHPVGFALQCVLYGTPEQ